MTKTLKRSSLSLHKRTDKPVRSNLNVDFARRAGSSEFVFVGAEMFYSKQTAVQTGKTEALFRTDSGLFELKETDSHLSIAIRFSPDGELGQAAIS
ncbi:hypothetical protein L1887_48783 [Cichorium endivia]|nr:hypothetical protein L1887_48783 [Cichorium endivia]